MRRRIRDALFLVATLTWVLMMVMPVMPWRDARIAYGRAPWEPDAALVGSHRFRFEHRAEVRDTPTPRWVVGFEGSRFKVAVADVPSAPVPNEIGRDLSILCVAGRCLFSYHIRSHAPWTTPSLAGVRWRMWFIDPPLLACLLATYPAWRAVRLLRRWSRRADVAAGWGLRFAPLVSALVLWTTSVARTDYATGAGRIVVQFAQPGVGVSDFGHHVSLDWHSGRPAPGAARQGEFLGFRYYSVGTSWASLAIPYFALVIAAVIPSLPALRQALRDHENSRRSRLGECVGCGYDLRGSPDQCPECGAVVPPAETAA
jgi:hypothetical protein